MVGYFNHLMQGKQTIKYTYKHFILLFLFTLFYTWSVPNSPFVSYTLDFSHYQNFMLFHQHLVSPDFIISGYQPLNTFLSFLTVFLGNQYPIIFQFVNALLLAGVLWNFGLFIHQLNPKRPRITTAISLLLLMGLSFFQKQIGCYENMWLCLIPAFLSLRMLLQKPLTLSSYIWSGLWLGIACAIHSCMVCVLGLELFWLLGQRHKHIFYWLAACMGGWLVLMFAWWAWLHGQAISILNWEWIANMFTSLDLYDTQEKSWLGWILYLACLAAGIGCFSPKYNRKFHFLSNPLIYKYSICVTLLWIISIYTGYIHTLLNTKQAPMLLLIYTHRIIEMPLSILPSQQYAFLLHILSIPVLAALITHTTRKGMQFVGGLLCTYILFCNTGNISVKIKTDHLLEAKFPYQITLQDQVFFNSKTNTFLATFLPPNMPIKLLTNQSNLSHPGGHTYLILSHPYSMPPDIMNTLQAQFPSKNKQSQMIPSICRPIITSYTVDKPPLLCQLPAGQPSLSASTVGGQ